MENQRNGSFALAKQFAQHGFDLLVVADSEKIGEAAGATETNFFHRAVMDFETKVGMSEKDDPADLAKTGFEALMAGDDHVVAGSFKKKVQATMTHVLPGIVTAEMRRKQAGPAHDDR